MRNILPYTIFFTIELILIADSNEIEDLDKIDLILTDQTGTFTKNYIYFNYCVITDGCYEYRNNGKNSSLNIISKDYRKI
jgi:magnesium-transporting ATPase (P-type)